MSDQCVVCLQTRGADPEPGFVLRLCSECRQAYDRVVDGRPTVREHAPFVELVEAVRNARGLTGATP